MRVLCPICLYPQYCGCPGPACLPKIPVGFYNKKRDSFSFENGSYSPIEIYKDPTNNSAAYVISAISLQEIDDGELLYKYRGRV